MTTPTVRRSSNQSDESKQLRSSSLPLRTRRVAAWLAEVTLVVTSGLIPFGIGAYADSRSDMSRVPLNPVLITAEREIARPLALPVKYGIRNVAWPTNFLWTIALFAPLTISGWQWYLLAKTGSTIPKRWFGIIVVNSKGLPPGFSAAIKREASRGFLPLAAAYLPWWLSPLFPNLSIFTVLAGVMVVVDATGFPLGGRRALHDRIAGTYTIDTTLPFKQSILATNAKDGKWNQGDEEEAIASVVMTDEETLASPLWWQWMRQNPSRTLLGIALLSMVGVLITLVGTQVYIQTQQNRRATQDQNSQQFITFKKQSDPKSGASPEERQRAISALGTLNYPPATQYLVDLLQKETDPMLLETIGQALINVGLEAIPDLKRMNLALQSQVDSNSSSSKSQELRLNQQTINKILAVHSGKTANVDLSRVELGESASGKPAFNLILDKVDLWGINFKGANLNSGSFNSSRFRGPGEDGRWDTFDDWTANLSETQLKQANLANANLSRLIMAGTDLSRANLQGANLSGSRLVGANLSSAQLLRADLRGTTLENASLTGADLSEAKLNDSDLYAARLGRVAAIGTQLSHANLTKTDWQAADLSSAYLNHANLSNANLSATRMTGAILQSANLENANLSNADLSLADLRGANLAGADFKGAILSPDKQNPADQFVQTPTVGAQSALVKGVDFSKVKNLDKQQTAYICTQGGNHPSCP